MKFISLLLVTILLGALGMSEYKIPYPQPDRDDNLLTKEIITGTLYQNLVSDSTVGIAPFEKYNFPTDIRNAGSVDFYKASDGSIWNETLDKLKERLYLPVFASAGEEDPQTLNMLPFIQNPKKGYINEKERISFIKWDDTSEVHVVDGIDDGALYFADRVKLTRYKDDEVEGLGVIMATNTRLMENKYTYMQYINDEVPSSYVYLNSEGYDHLETTNMIVIYVINSKGEMIKRVQVPLELSSYWGEEWSDDGYLPEKYTVTNVQSYEDELYCQINLSFYMIKDGAITEILNERNTVNLDEDKMWFVHSYTYRYTVLQRKSRSSGKYDGYRIYDKKLKKLLPFIEGVDKDYCIINPVLGTIAHLEDNVINVYNIASGSQELIVKDHEYEDKNEDLIYKTYCRTWIGNLKYDYLLSDVFDRVAERGNYPLRMGNVETNLDVKPAHAGGSFFGTTGFERMTGNNTDDFSLAMAIYASGGGDVYTNDGENFLFLYDNFISNSGYIRTWGEDKALYQDSGDSKALYTTFFTYE